jgi:trk system potassium uptake protein TrkH
LLLAVAFWWREPVGFWHALHHAAFNVVSVVTTTGFASTDYGQWGGMAVVVFFFLTFMGGCTGSTSGAIKVFRFEILFALVRVQLARLVRPHAVYPLRYGGKPLPRTVANSVLGFFFMYFAVFAAASVAMAFHGYDFLTSISGAAATLGNVGPGLGPIIGPVGNYSSLADTAKWVLSAAMLLGRLELFTVLVLFLPAFWRN